MKKHPLDDFFAERLSENQVTPSQSAMDRFQERLAEREKKASPFLGIRPKSWYYYGAAASVALLMTIGYLEYKGGELSTDSFVLAEVRDQKEKKPEVSVSLHTSQMANTADQPVTQHVSPDVTPVVRHIQPMFESKAYEKPALAQNKMSVDDIIVKTTETNEGLQNQLALAVETADKNKLPETKAIAADQNQLFKNDGGETLVLITAIPEEEAGSLPHQDSGLKVSKAVAMNAQASDEEKSVFSRVFGELRNLKHGEKIDLGKLGLKPADREPDREEGFIASETRQIRESWQWIKGKINNN